MPDHRSRRGKLEDMARRGTPAEQRVARAKLKAMGGAPSGTTHRPPFRASTAQRGPEPVRPRFAYAEYQVTNIHVGTDRKAMDERKRIAQEAMDRVFRSYGINVIHDDD